MSIFTNRSPKAAIQARVFTEEESIEYDKNRTHPPLKDRRKMENIRMENDDGTEFIPPTPALMRAVGCCGIIFEKKGGRAHMKVSCPDGECEFWFVDKSI